jgi:PPM family protein phosphatase
MNMSKDKTVLAISIETNKGVERDHNEDNHVFCPDLKNKEWLFYDKRGNVELGELGSLLVVADGMGGMNAGEVASELAIEGIKGFFTVNLKSEVVSAEGKIKSFLKSAILSANDKIIKRQNEDSATEGMGTTIILAWIIGNKVYVSWSGDSRCYRYNPNTGLQALSKDHSYVQALIDAGKLTEEQAFYHPDSNIVTQSLGDSKHIPKPDFAAFELNLGDKILLCSDGLNAMLQDHQIQETFENSTDINSCIKTLITQSNDAGGHDNITIGIAEVETLGSTEISKGLFARIKPFLLYVLVGVIAFLLAFVYFKYFDKEETVKDATEQVRSVDEGVNQGQNETQGAAKTATAEPEATEPPASENQQGGGSQVPENEDQGLVDDVVLDNLLEILQDVLTSLNEADKADQKVKTCIDNVGLTKLAYGQFIKDQSEKNTKDVCNKVGLLVNSFTTLNLQTENFNGALGELESFEMSFCQNTDDQQIETLQPSTEQGELTKITKPEEEPELEVINKTGLYDAEKDPENIGLSPIEKDGKWGFVNKAEQIMIPCEYEKAYGFHEGLAFVKINEGWAVIDKNGIPKIQAQKLWHKPEKGFANGLAQVRDVATDSLFCINVNNEKVVCE